MMKELEKQLEFEFMKRQNFKFERVIAYSLLGVSIVGAAICLGFVGTQYISKTHPEYIEAASNLIKSLF